MEIRYDFDTGTLYMQLAIYGNDAHREVEITPTCFAGITRNGRVCHITLTKPREPWPILEILWRFASMPKETKAILELLRLRETVEPPMTVGAALLAGMPNPDNDDHERNAASVDPNTRNGF